MKFSYTLEIFDKILTCLQFSFELFEFYIWADVILASFNFDRITDCSMHLLRLIKISSAKISSLSLINLVGMSVLCVALFDCDILISFRISTFSTNEKLKLDLEVQFSLMAIILVCTLYFTMALMTGSLKFSDVRSIWLNYRMLRLVTILARNSFKT